MKKWFHFPSAFICLILILSYPKEAAFLFALDVTQFWGSGYNICVVVDWLSFVFLAMVGFVSLEVVKFAYVYMAGDFRINRFLYTLFVFTCSMIILVVSTNLFWIMIGWDGLGLSSFCLILFYQNWKSFNSGMVTFLLNRVGDLFFFLSISVTTLLNYSCSWVEGSNLSTSISLMMLIGMISKCAQIPFSAWLPLAMAAPTPVSALVHSSTLVTAGVYVLVRFFSWIPPLSLLILTLVSFLTILIAGLSSLGEFDLKKIIALSTLTHIGFILFFSSLGSTSAALVHMVTHAMFKSALFMMAGNLIHLESENQDIRSLMTSSRTHPWWWVMFCSTILSMAGCPFLAGFYSKEVLLSALGIYASCSWLSVWVGLGFFLAAGLTCSYSIRLIYYITSSPSSSVLSSILPPNLLPSGFMSVVSGSLAIWVISFPGQFFSLSFLVSQFKLILLLTMVLGVVIGVLVCKVNSFLGGFWPLIMNFWFVGSLGTTFQSKFFNSSFFLFSFNDSKGVLDFLIGSVTSKLFLLSKELNSAFYTRPSSLMFICFLSLLCWSTVSLMI